MEGRIRIITGFSIIGASCESDLLAPNGMKDAVLIMISLARCSHRANDSCFITPSAALLYIAICLNPE